MVGSFECCVGTYKLVKTELQKEGFDPKMCGQDKLFYADAKSGEYKPLGNDEYELILKGKIRF